MSTYASGTVVAKAFTTQSVARPLARKTAAAGRGGRKVLLTGIIGKGVGRQAARYATGGGVGALLAGPAARAVERQALKRGADPEDARMAHVMVRGVGGAFGGGANVARGTIRDIRRSVGKGATWSEGKTVLAAKKPKTMTEAVARRGKMLSTPKAQTPLTDRLAVRKGLDDPVRPLTQREKDFGLTPDMIMTHRDVRRQKRVMTGLAATGAAGAGYGAVRLARRVHKGVLADVGASLQGINKPAAAGSVSSPAAATPSTGLVAAKPTSQKAAAGTGAKKVSKRRYDPEDERRHRQGFEAGALATGGALSLGYGVRGVRRDTQGVFKIPDLPHEGPRPEHQKTYGGKPYDRLTGDAKREADEKLRAKVGDWRARGMARHAVRDLKSQRGLLVRPKPAALLGGGLAALTVAGAHQQRRHESRYT